MAQDQNSLAKSGEVARRRKTDKKRKGPDQRMPKAEQSLNSAESRSKLSAGELSVLDVFRSYLMTPGKMLCFGTFNRRELDLPLAQLTDKGFLVAERFPGGYALTEAGFLAMTGSAPKSR